MAIADGANEPEMTHAFSALCCLLKAHSQSQVTDPFPGKQQGYVTHLVGFAKLWSFQHSDTASVQSCSGMDGPDSLWYSREEPGLAL